MIVRDATEADFDQWLDLFVAYGVFYETEFSSDHAEKVWRALLDPEHPETCFVANERGTLVGFVHIQLQYDTFRPGTSWFIDDLYVLPDYRGRSIGRELIDHAKTFAFHNGGGDIKWITADTNEAAMGLYDQLATKTRWVMYEMPSGKAHS